MVDDDRYAIRRAVSISTLPGEPGYPEPQYLFGADPEIRLTDAEGRDIPFRVVDALRWLVLRLPKKRRDAR